MNIIDKYVLLGKMECDIPPEGTSEYQSWAKYYKLIIDATPLANSVIDSIKFRQELLKSGFNFEDIKKIMTLINSCSINKNYNRVNINLAELTEKI